MAVTVSGTSITFNDASVQTTAASAPTTANVLAALAGTTHQAVGSMTIAWNTTTGGVSQNSNIAGGSLRFTDRAISPLPSSGSSSNMFGTMFFENNPTFPTNTSVLSGTWKNIGGYCRGRYDQATGDGNYTYMWFPSLWLRVS